MNTHQILVPRDNRAQPKVLRAGGHSIKGDFRLVIKSAAGIILRETDWMPNLVTNGGLDRIGNALGAIGSYCRIGTGNTAPAFTDTALVSQSASTTNVITSSATNIGTPDYETESTTTFEFALGAVVGNMAEIGLGWASSGATLFTRALIVDGLGSPTTITVLVTEILQVVYRITMFPNLVDDTGTVSIGGTSYDYVSRTSNSGSALAIAPTGAWMGSNFGPTAYNGAIGAHTAAPAGSSTGLTAGSFSTYNNGDYFRDFAVTAALAAGNLAGGISAIRTSVGSASAVFNSQISFDATVGGASIPKDNTKTMSITFRQYWSRH